MPRQRGADAGEQLGEAEGLDQVIVGTACEAGGNVAFVAARGEQEHGDRCGRGIGLEPLEHLEAMEHREDHVERDQVGPDFARYVERGDAIIDRVDAMPEPL